MTLRLTVSLGAHVAIETAEVDGHHGLRPGDAGDRQHAGDQEAQLERGANHLHGILEATGLVEPGAAESARVPPPLTSRPRTRVLMLRSFASVTPGVGGFEDRVAKWKSERGWLPGTRFVSEGTDISRNRIALRICDVLNVSEMSSGFQNTLTFIFTENLNVKMC